MWCLYLWWLHHVWLNWALAVSSSLPPNATCCLVCDWRLLLQNVEYTYKNSKRRSFLPIKCIFLPLHPSVHRIAMPPKGTRQKRSHQDTGVVNTLESGLPSAQSGADTHKKAKTGVENIGVVCFRSHNRCITDLVISSAPFFKREQRQWRSNSSTSKSRAHPNRNLSQGVKDGPRYCQWTFESHGAINLKSKILWIEDFWWCHKQFFSFL